MSTTTKVSTKTEPTDIGEHNATILTGGGLANGTCSCGWTSALFAIVGDRDAAIRAASIEWAAHLAEVTS